MQTAPNEQPASPRPERKAHLLRGLTYGLVTILVFLLGISTATYFGVGGRRGTSSKLDEIYSLIQQYYVDSANMDSLSEEALPFILSQLDPHSVYLNAEENKASTETLEGSFAGIGIQFNTLLDTVVVVRVIEGGPSERAGLQAGDRILRADTTSFLRDSLTSEEIMKALKGPEDTVVKLTLQRGKKVFTTSVVRGAVPVPTLDASYMIRPHVLYVRLNKWGTQTPIEFQQAYADHASEGVERILLDLRDNGGGYLQAATTLASEFLSKGDLLVYNQGAHYPREDFKCPRDGRLRQVPLTVLVNENSASASEIFAGAMQDLDRALIVGRRTFGKGLVQLPFELRDHSVVRLTVARYYTPSGRSIQKSYAKGYEAYAEDIEDRYLHGELYSADSISRPDTTRYYTRLGRIVYGGGGITPDIFTPRDSTGINPYYIRLLRSGTLQRFAFSYADSHRAQFLRLGSDAAVQEYLQAQGEQIVYAYARYADQKGGVAQRPGYLQESMAILRRDLIALIYDLLGRDKDAFYRLHNERDPEVLKALEQLTSSAWRPHK